MLIETVKAYIRRKERTPRQGLHRGTRWVRSFRDV